MRKKFLLMLTLLILALGGSGKLFAQQLLVNCDYNSSTEGYGVTKFSNYDGAYAYATANGKTTATIVIEKTNTISGNCFNNNHKNYSKLAVVIKDGATMGNSLSKWDMTYPVTVEPGGTLTCARGKGNSISNIHIKNKLIVGAKDATKKAYVNFLSDEYQDCDISIRYNGSIEVYNADFYVQDLDAQGKLTIEDSKVEVDGAFASATSIIYPTTLTNSTITINGNQISGGLSDFSGGAFNQLGNVKINNSTLTIKEGDTKVAANVTATNSAIDVNKLTINSGKTLNLNDGSTLDAENIDGTGSVKIDGVAAPIIEGAMYVPVSGFAALKAAVEAGNNVQLTADITTTSAIVTSGVTSVIDLNGKTLTIGAGDNKFNDESNVTIKNGNVNITNVTVTGNAIFCLDEYEKTLVSTLTFDNVNLTGDGYSSAYGIFYIGESSVLNVNGGEWNLKNDKFEAGGVFKADASGAELNIDGLELTAHNVRRVVTHANTTIENSTMTISGDAEGVDAEMEHGFNRSPLAISNSTITMKDMLGRGITAENGAVTISENSNVNITNCIEATIDVRNNQTVTIDNTSTVFVDKEPTLANGCTINGTVKLPTVAKIGAEEYSYLADALEAAKSMTGDVTVEICAKVTMNQPLAGSYTSIKFVGPQTRNNTDAEIYLDVQGYITATGKKVAFENLKLSKSEGGFIANAGFMNVAFGIFDVAEVSYTNCTFLNGAYASSGKVTYTGCTFKKSWDKYGLWAYGNVDVTVNGCTFADYRGIKMYAENGANASVEKPNLTVKNTNFSDVDNKPAIVLTYGESVTLEGNTYSSTGVFELDLDGKPNGVVVTSDEAPTCINDNGACGVLVDGEIYTTVAQAAEVATSSSTVTLLHDSAETVELPYGVELDKNGFTANGVTVAPPAAKIGDVEYATLSEAFAAVTADDQTVVVCKDVTENLTGAYLRGNITTENGAEVTITLTNSDWVYCPYTFVLDEYITLNVPRLFYYAGGTQINGKVVAGAYYQRYAGTKLTINEPGSMTVTSETCIIRNMDGDANAGIYVNGDNDPETVGLKLAVAYFYQGMINAKNANIVAGTYWQTNETDGQGSANLVLDNSTLTVTVYDHPAKATGNSTVTLKNGSTLDASHGGFTYGDNTILSVDATSKIIGKNGEEVKVPVAKINGIKYYTLEDAFKAATENCTIEILSDVTVDYAWDARYTGAKFTVPVTINGNGKTIKFTNTVYDGGNYMSAFRFEADATVENLTVDMSEALSGFAGRFRAISAKANLTVDGCTFIGNGSENNTRAIIFGEGATAIDQISIKNSTFTGWRRGISDNESGKDVVAEVTITDNTLENSAVCVSAKENVTFTGNTVEGAYVDIRSYSADNALNVTATGNTLEENTDNAYNYIKAGGTVDAQVEFKLAPVAKIGNDEYTTLAEAFDAAVEGDVVRLLINTTLAEGLTTPAGITIDGNDKQINGTINAGGDLTFVGHTKVTAFSASYYNRVITIGEGACLEITGGGRVSLAYGNTFNITGSIENAKTADKANVQASLIIPAGISITGGNDAAMNVTNAYVQIGSTTSKNNAADGTFTLNFTNSIVEFTKEFALAEPTSGKNPTFNMNIKDCVLTTGTKFIAAAPNSNVVVDNSVVTLGTYFRNSGMFDIVNGSVFTGATIQFCENSGNNGTITVDASELTINATSTGHALDGISTGSITLKNEATASIDYIKDMAIEIDVTSLLNMTKLLGTTTVDVDVTGINSGEATVIKGNMSEFAKDNITVKGGTIKTKNETGLTVKRDGGTWGGIDWTLTEGTLVIKPTAGEPVPDKNAPTKRTYEVGEWRERVIYKSNGSASAIGGEPYDMKAVNKLIIEEGVTKIGSFTAQFPNLTGEVVIPSTVTYIGQEAFYAGSTNTTQNINKLTFTVGGTSPLCIANGAFKSVEITEVAFPGDREYIHLHHWIFQGSPKLETAYIPANVTKCWGGEHVDYFDNYDSQTNPSWTYTSSIFTGCTAMQTITFENEAARDNFFGSNRNSTAEDPMVAYAGLTAYNTFAEALEAALENEYTLGLAKNVNITDPIDISKEETLTFNLNGKTLSQSKACTASYEMINNKGNLTITGNGKISFTDTSAGDPSFGWGSYTVRNEGTLVVENGTIEHKGAQSFATHMICAIFQYSGSTTINGGTISTPNYRSARLWKGDMTINGGTFNGQVWVQAVDNSAKLTINGGTFSPKGNDASSVFVSNDTYNVELAVTDGTFNGKVGCSDAAKLAGTITGGKFTETAKNGTNSALIATGLTFGEADADGYFSVVDDPTTHYIKNLAELKAFRDEVNSGNTYAGVTVYLGADIDLEQENWTPINKFNGTFDGQNHTISNLSVVGDGNVGFFKQVADQTEHVSGTVKNVNFENATIISQSGNGTAGIIANALLGARINNVNLTGEVTISGYRGVGGIVGAGFPVIDGCKVEAEGTITATYWGAGGILGFASDKGAKAIKSTVKGIGEGLTIHGELGGVGSVTGTPHGAAVDGATINDVNITSNNDYYMAYVDASGEVKNANVDNVVVKVNGNVIVGCDAVATIGTKPYFTFADAVAAADNNATINLIWKEGKAPIAMNASLYGKSVTITGTAKVDWSKGWLFVGRGGEGNATLTFNEAYLTSASDNSTYGIHVSGREKNTTNKYDGTVVINNSTIELDYLINRGTMTLDENATLTVKNGFGIAGRPASETESGEDATATLTLKNNSKVVVNNHNGMGLGQAANVLEGLGVMNINSGSTFECTQDFLVTANGTMNVNGGVVKIAENNKLNNNGAVVVTGNSKLYVKNYSGNAIQLNNGNLTDSYFAGRIDAFGVNNISGTTEIGGILGLGHETNPTEQVVVNITGNFKGTNVLVRTNNGVDNLLNVGNADGGRTTAYFAQLGAFADVNIVNSDVTYGYTFIRNDFNVTNSTLAINGGVNTYLSGNAKVVLDNTTWNLSGYANIGSYGGYMYGNADVTLKNSSRMTATNLGIEVSGENVVKLTLEDNSSLTATNLKNHGTIVLASTEATLTSNECGNVTTNVANMAVLYKDGKYTLVPPIAKIDETPYATLQAAVNAAKEGATITLLSDIEQVDGVIITDKNLTVDLNEKTFKVTEGASTNNRNFKINGASVVTIKNGTMIAAGDYSSGAYGTVRTEGTANVTLTGLKLYNYRGNGLNIKAYAGTTVAIDNTEIYSQYGGGIEAAGGTITLAETVKVEQKGMYTAPYNSMAISVNGGGKVTVNGGTYSTECIKAEDANNQGTSHGPWVVGVLNSGGTLIINGGTFSNDNFGDNSLATAARGAVLADTGANIEINGGTFNALKAIIDVTNNLGDPTKNPSAVLSGGTFSADPTISGLYASHLIKIAKYYTVVENDGIYSVVKDYVAQVGEERFVTLQEAFNVGGEVVVLKNITLEETATIAAGKEVVLDLNGHTISQVKECTASYEMISNKGKLTIEGNGKISFKDTGAGDPTFGWGSYTLRNEGTLVVENGTIEHLGEQNPGNGQPNRHMYCAIFQYSGSSTINGGTISTPTYRSARLWSGDMTINGGNFVGQLWLQAVNNTSDLTINGGTFTAAGNDGSSVFVSNSSYDVAFAVTGGTFNHKIGANDVEKAGVKGSISGGLFSQAAKANTDAKLIDARFKFEDMPNIDGYYSIIQFAGTQTREFASAGWYWFSTYIDLEGTDGLDTLQEALGENAKQIKGQDGFTQYYKAYQAWSPGGLTAISTAKMYMINTTDPVTVELTGDFVDYEERDITLNPGWNWIGYPVRDTVNVKDALANLIPSNGDAIKSKDWTMTYIMGQWLGSREMTPGMGYMYKSNAGSVKTFRYSTNVTNNSRSENTVEEYHWIADATKYPSNMTVIAMLNIDGEVASDNYEVAAFANGECRGSARPFYVEAIDSYILIMTIQGEEVEELTFKCYDVNYDTEYELSNRFNYSSDAILGSIEEPYMFNMNFLNIEESSLDMINIYPNPTTRDRAISLQATCDNVEVFNALGVKVAEYQNVDTIDALETAGVYVIRVTINGEVKNCRLVVE